MALPAPLVGGGSGGSFLSSDPKWGVETHNKIRVNFIDLDARAVNHEARLDDLEAAAIEDGALQYGSGTISSAEMLALRATPKELAAAPGAGKILDFVGLVLFHDAGVAYVESAANLGVKYENGSGTQVSETIEMTGFIDQTSDVMIKAGPAAQAAIPKTACENKALVLHNLGAAEFTTGDGPVEYVVIFRRHATGW